MLLLLALGAQQDGAGLLGAGQLVVAALADQAAIVNEGDDLLALGHSLAVDRAACEPKKKRPNDKEISQAIPSNIRHEKSQITYDLVWFDLLG